MINQVLWHSRKAKYSLHQSQNCALELQKKRCKLCTHFTAASGLKSHHGGHCHFSLTRNGLKVIIIYPRVASNSNLNSYDLDPAHTIKYRIYTEFQGRYRSNDPHDDVIKWKHFPRNWPFVRGIHRSQWVPHTKASDAELWCFLWSASE